MMVHEKQKGMLGISLLFLAGIFWSEKQDGSISSINWKFPIKEGKVIRRLWNSVKWSITTSRGIVVASKALLRQNKAEY